MDEDDILERGCDAFDFFYERLQCRHLHFVLTVHLLYDQFTIEMCDDAVWLVRLCEFQPFDEGAIFSDIIRFDADALEVFPEDRTADGILKDAADRRLPWIAARPAVAEQVNCSADVPGYVLGYIFCLQCFFHEIRHELFSVTGTREQFPEAPFDVGGEAEHERSMNQESGIRNTLAS